MPRLAPLMLRAAGPRLARQFTTLCRAPAQTQQRLLRRITHANADTAFGRRHGFGDIAALDDYRRRVPISQYEDLEPYIRAAMEGRPNQLTHEEPVLFTTTSGTTGASKYIPMTPTGRGAKARLMSLWLSALYRDHPGIVAGRILSIVSPEVESYAPNGTPCGSESGHAYRNMPKPVRAMYAIPYDVFTIADYEARYYTLLRLACGQDLSCIVTVNPSTVLLVADRLAQHSERIIRDVREGALSEDFAVSPAVRSSLRLRPDTGRARELERAATNGSGSLRPDLVWPGIQAIGCWKGGTVGSYLAMFQDRFPQAMPVRDLGYLATELRGSVPLVDEGDAGVVAVGTNVLEFHPADTDREPQAAELLSVDQLETGRRYFVFVTTDSGLYRYDMNDIIEVVGTYEQTPLIRFVQKGKGVVSFTGEKLYEVQVLAAVEDALADLHGRYHFIAAVAEQMDGSQPPRLVFLIEFNPSTANRIGPELVDRIDAALGNHNSEYQAKRKSLRYGAPVIRAIHAGEYDRYRRRMVEGGRADGQFKILRLTSDPTFATEFKAERDVVGTDDATR
jgi:hypothetical protein